jgi:hypothetical protein
MTLDLTKLPVVDVHCHPFLKHSALSADQFTTILSFGGGSPAFMAESGLVVDDALRDELRRNKQDTLYFRYLVHCMADFLGCVPTVADVVAARNIAATDYASYVDRLFAACGLTTLITDFGYPQPPIAVDSFVADMPATVVPVFRIEPLIVELLQAPLGWPEFSQRFDETIAAALTSGYRGLKSIIAYRTGLDISPLSRSPDQGRLALDAIRRGTGGQAMKKLRDHLVCRAMELCIEHDVPMQIHTGMGDVEVNLTACRPALLMDLLRFPTFRACRVLLVHGGYPYHTEAGYMANVLPRVYVDVSEGIPFAGAAARRIFAEVLEMTPVSKIVYGSDGFGAPEINYVSAILGKHALASTLEQLIEARILNRDDALGIARQILAENARSLYQLD